MLGIGERRELPVVLVIDDDLVSREVIATILTLDGYPVHTAADGDAALQMLHDGLITPGVVLMDAQLPGLAGIELIRRLRALSPASLYAISGSAPPPEVAAAADGFLLKPIEPLRLRQLLEEREPTTDPEPPPHLSPIDSHTLSQLQQMMPPATVRSIYEAVVDDLKMRMDALNAAIAAGDAVEVRRIGHSIKGGCGMAGAAEAAHIGALFENEDDNLNQSAILLERLHTVTERLAKMLEGELNV